MTSETPESELKVEVEVDDLRARLADAEETLRAIRDGDADAVVVAGSQGDEVHVLGPGDRVYREFIEAMAHGTATVSADMRILSCDTRLAATLGFSVDQIVGADLEDYFSPEDREGVRVFLAQSGAASAVLQTRLVTCEGHTVPVYLSATILRSSGERPLTCLTFTDLATVVSAEKALEWLATHNPLTKLPNRSLLDDRLTTALARSKRFKSVTAMLHFDLDHFEDVNDTLGHPAGDRLLVTIAERCLSIVRESDTVGHTGGGEFAVIVTDYVSAEDLSTLAGRLLSAIGEPVTLGERDVYVTASIGIAVYPEDGTDAEKLAAHAGVALHRAKTLGMNRFQFYNAGLQDELNHRIKVETGLRQVLMEDRLFMVYQPQVDLHTGAIVGVEALVRWREVDGTVIMPGEFIPIAETSDLILEVGDAVLRHAIADKKVLFAAGHRITMAVNVAARQWMEQDIAAVVIEAVNAAGLILGHFEVEITESAIVSRVDTAAAKVRSLQEAGVAVSIDDFGTGYASMSYVMEFRPSKLKIDRSFVSRLPDDPNACAIVNATIALAHTVGAKVLAEGPETEAHVRYLREHGCDLAQGFHFSKPVPLDELLLLLDQGPFSLPD